MGVSVALLALFLLTIDVRRMADALADANYLWVIPAVALYLVSVVFRTLRWRVLLLHMKPVSVARLYPVVVVGYMANNILPVRLGEVVRYAPQHALDRSLRIIGDDKDEQTLFILGRADHHAINTVLISRDATLSLDYETPQVLFHER